jgi:two-component system, chemotaxis family, protein-glutamate methylesterase/glutaminase
MTGFQPWAEPAASERLVVIATSAGGLHALFQVLGSLPADFPAAIAIVQHRSDQHPSLLPALLEKRTALRVRHAGDGNLLEAGTVYICPPGMHMAAEHCIRLVKAPRLNYVRPSADMMFRSAAHAYGDRAIGVVLSGNGVDGAVGCCAITEAGGTVVVQDPMSAAYPGMPAAAVESGRADMVLPLEEIGEALQRLVTASRPVPVRATTVLLADDHRILLDGLRVLLAREGDLEVIAEAADGRTAVRLAGELSPDVVVMDIAMPDLDGINATRRIREQNPRTRVVALSAHGDAQTAAQILEAGATGYLCKSTAFTELAVAIRAVAAQQSYLSPRFAGGTMALQGVDLPR